MSREIPAEQALKLFWESEGTDVPSRHSAQTDECYSFSEFGNHVTGKKLFSREQLEHINQCLYCQTTRTLFRKHCGLSPLTAAGETYDRIRKWVSENFLLPRQAVPHLAPVQAQGMPRARDYYLAVIDGSGELLADGRAIITRGPLVTPDGCLLFWIAFDIPESLRSRFPMELGLVPLADEQAALSLDLPELGEQMMKVRIPEPLLPQAQQVTETEGALPFGLVLRPGESTLLAHALVA